MAIKRISLEGFYSRGEQKFNIAMIKESGKEIINFKDIEGNLCCSVYRVFIPNAPPQVQYYGDYSIFRDFENARMQTKFIKMVDVSAEETLFSEDGVSGIKRDFVRKSADYDQRLVYIDKDIILEHTKCQSFEIYLNYTSINKKLTVKPLPGFEYKAKVDITSKDVMSRIVNIRDLKSISLEKDISWLDNKNYSIINEQDDFDYLVRELKKFPGPIAFDTETTGLSINRFPYGHPKRDRLCGICISYEKDTGFYLPVYQQLFDNLDEERTMAELKPVLERKHIVTHYGIFDWKVMWYYGIDLNIIDDTYMLQYMVDSKSSKKTKKLKEMTKMRYDIDQLELEDFFPKKGRRKQQIDFSMLPYSAVHAYGPADADFTLMHYNDLRPNLPAQMNFIYATEISLLRKIARTEYYGIRIDKESLNKKYEKALEKTEQLEKQIIAELSKYTDNPKININSPTQLGDILFSEDKMNCPILVYTKGKVPKPSTGTPALKRLKFIKDEEGNTKYPVVSLLLDYKKNQKLITAFYQRLLKDEIDGYIFPRFNPAGAESGRIAGYNPNLQQIDNNIKDLFVPDSDEHYIIDVDYKQIEYRVMVSLARETALMKQFEHPEVDFHVIMASLLFGVPQENVTPAMRKKSKALNFGIPYGMGDYSLAISIHGDPSEENIQDAHDKKEIYFERVPNVRDLFINTKDLAQLTGYTETAFHRIRYFPDLLTSSDNRVIAGERRKAGNTKIQGTAADILKIAYDRVTNMIARENLHEKVRVAGSIHDELLFVVHKSVHPWFLIPRIREAMELKLKNFCPLYTGIAVAKNWENGKSDVREIPTQYMDKYCAENKLMTLAESEDMYNSRLAELRAQGKGPEAIDYDEEFRLQVLNFRATQIRDYIESVLGGWSKNINLAVLEKLYVDVTIVAILNKFFIGEDKEPKEGKRKEYLANALRFIFEELEGTTEYNLYIDKAEAEALDGAVEELYEDEDDSEMFKEMLEEDDEILDEDIEDFHEEKVFVDYSAMRRAKNKNSKKLKIKSEPIPTAVQSFRLESRVIIYDRTCYIKLDGITKPSLDKLKEYLSKHKDPNGYKVVFEYQGDMKETKIKVLHIDRDDITNIICGVATVA